MNLWSSAGLHTIQWTFLQLDIVCIALELVLYLYGRELPHPSINLVLITILYHHPGPSSTFFYSHPSHSPFSEEIWMPPLHFGRHLTFLFSSIVQQLGAPANLQFNTAVIDPSTLHLGMAVMAGWWRLLLGIYVAWCRTYVWQPHYLLSIPGWIKLPCGYMILYLIHCICSQHNVCSGNSVMGLMLWCSITCYLRRTMHRWCKSYFFVGFTVRSKRLARICIIILLSSIISFLCILHAYSQLPVRTTFYTWNSSRLFLIFISRFSFPVWRLGTVRP